MQHIPLRTVRAKPRAFNLNRAAPRRGQALLLAVLLTIIAGFLGSTFVTVVMMSVEQTAHG